MHWINQFFFLLKPRFTIPVGLGWLVLNALLVAEVVDVKSGYLLGVIGLSFVFGETFEIENPVLEKSVMLAFNIGCGLFNEDINSEGFGNVVFFLELGLTLISGKKDSLVFSSLYNL